MVYIMLDTVIDENHAWLTLVSADRMVISRP